MKWTDMLLDLLFPPRCPFCGALTEKGEDICARCRAKLPWIEGKHSLRELGRFPCAAPLWYEDLVRQGMLRLKFHGGAWAARALGALVAQCAAEHFGGEFDIVTWVPVSAKRLRKRGYDQSRLLAQSACRLWDTKPQALLRKLSDNPPQSSLADEAARRANVLGMYTVTNPAAVAGKRILLIDDICTTGATLRECARVLESAGAQSVVCATVAMTPLKMEKGDKERLQSLESVGIM